MEASVDGNWMSYIKSAHHDFSYIALSLMDTFVILYKSMDLCFIIGKKVIVRGQGQPRELL